MFFFSLKLVVCYIYPCNETLLFKGSLNFFSQTMARTDITDGLDALYPCLNAINRGMCDYESRFGTFQTWDRSIMQPEELAEAGFFYMGITIG